MNKKLLTLVVLSALGTLGGVNAATYTSDTTLDGAKYSLEGTASEDNRFTIFVKDNASVNLISTDADISNDVPSSFNGWNAGICTVGATFGSTASRLNVSSTGNYSIGVWAAKGSEINLSGNILTVNVHGENYAYGVYAQNGTTDSTDPLATVNIDAKDIYVKATSATPGTASGLVAMSQGILNINGNLTVEADNVIITRGDARTTINKSGQNTVKLTGDIVFNYDGGTSGTPVDAYVDVTLSGKDSFWTGNSYVSWNDTKPTESYLTVSAAPVITLNNGAIWTPTQVKENDNHAHHHLDKLTLNNGVVNLNSDVNTGVKNLVGSGIFNIAVNNDRNTGTFSVTNDNAEQLQVNLTGVDSDSAQADDAKGLVGNALKGINDGKTTINVNEGFYNGAYVVDPNGNVKTSKNTIMRDTLDIAAGSTVMLNRILMNDVHKRMGDLRNNAGMNGAWVRYDGGRLSGGHVANKFNTIQLGADMPFADNFHAGVSASYTRGDVDFTRGGAGMDAYSLAAYGTWFAPNGMYADVVARYGHVKNELTVDHNLKGDLDNNAVALSGEFGWKFDVADNFFVTPQVEATYMHIDSDTVKLGNKATYMHIDSDTVKLGNKASYKFDSVDSFIGRAGLAAGYTFPNQKGNVFVKASAVHEFAGDSKVTGANGTNLKKDGKDTWAEFGVGTQYNFNKNVQAWANLERTAGADIEEDYRATVGARINF